MKNVFLKGFLSLFWLLWLLVIATSVQATLDSNWNSVTGANISGWNVASYNVGFMFSGSLDTGDVVILELIWSGSTMSSFYTGIGWETAIVMNFNASSLADWSIILSGLVHNASWILVTGSNSTTNVSKDTISALWTINYSRTWGWTAPVVASLSLNESGTITNNGGSGNRTFSSNGSFTFTFKDTFGNVGSATATVANIFVTLPWGAAYIYFPVGYSGSLNPDYCPYGDNSSSRYDFRCDPITDPSIPTYTNSFTWKVITVPEAPAHWSTARSPYSAEMNEAYLYNYQIGATTISSILNANINGHLTRAQMAKMMSRYAISVKWMTADSSKSCWFDDISTQNSELQDYMRLSCQLGIMGNNMSIFNPNGIVSRAEFGTVLSRVLFGSTYEDWFPYYTNHLQALYNANFIRINDPNLIETRWNVMLMLFRAAQ